MAKPVVRRKMRSKRARISLRRRAVGVSAVGLEVGVEPPDQAANELLGGALLVGERLQLVHQPLRMDPAQGVRADVELPGIVADDHRLVQEPVRGDGAPQRALGGDARRVGGHLQRGDAELLQMALPGRLIGKLPLRMPGQLPDHRSGQVVLAHVVQRRLVDDVIGVAGAQQFEEVQPALAAGGAEPGEVVVADLRADGVGAAMARAGVVHA